MAKEIFPDWHAHLLANDEGAARPLLANVLTVLREDPAFAGAIGMDKLRAEAMVLRKLPWDVAWLAERSWTDNDDRCLAEWLQRNFIFVGVALAAEAVQVVAAEHSYHPVLDYLRGLRWDGVERLDDWAVDYLGCPNTPYVRAVSSRWMISAVARVNQPGCKADCALVLEGSQGIGKSTALRTLGAPWFTDEIAALGTKDAAEQTIGVWIVELAELDAVTRAADIAHVKAFMSRQADRFRFSYGRRVGEHPRQCVFAATSNNRNWNRDDSGGRRWWPLSCGEVRIAALAEARDQLWAEARDRYDKPERWWLDSSQLVEAANLEQEERSVEDPLASRIAELTRYMVTTTTDAVLIELGFDARSRGKPEAMRVASILRQMGWSRHRRREGSLLVWEYRAPEREHQDV